MSSLSISFSVQCSMKSHLPGILPLQNAKKCFVSSSSHLSFLLINISCHRLHHRYPYFRRAALRSSHFRRPLRLRAAQRRSTPLSGTRLNGSHAPWRNRCGSYVALRALALRRSVGQMFASRPKGHRPVCQHPVGLRPT